MLDKIKKSIDFSQQALEMRAKRQGVIASNISNVDTPNYKAVDVDFANALSEATGVKKPSGSESISSAPRLEMAGQSTSGMLRTHAAHIEGNSGDPSSFGKNLKFRRGDTASLDGNSVNIERERASFAENTVKYEASLRSIDGRIRSLKSVMKTGF